MGHCDLYFMVQCFALYLEDDLMYKHDALMSQYDLLLDLKTKVYHCDLYFMVQ